MKNLKPLKNQEIEAAFDYIKNFFDECEIEKCTCYSNPDGSCPFCNQMTKGQSEIRKIEAYLGAIKMRNLKNAVKRICEVCGHEKNEDGCAFCLKAKHAEEHTTFVAVAKLFNVDLENSTPNQVYEQFQQLK